MDRIDQLARRVRWLDRHRRHVAVAIALVVTSVMALWCGLLDDDLAVELGAATFAAATGIVTWWLVEVALAWQTAVWDTEHHLATRTYGRELPIARLLRSRLQDYKTTDYKTTDSGKPESAA